LVLEQYAKTHLQPNDTWLFQYDMLMNIPLKSFRLLYCVVWESAKDWPPIFPGFSYLWGKLEEKKSTRIAIVPPQLSGMK
jgi:hypothetical protein